MTKNFSLLTRLIILGFSLATIIVLIFISYVTIANAPVSEKKNPTSFYVVDGQSIHNIIYTLQEEGLIRNALFLKLYLKISPTPLSIQSGHYTIPLNLTAIKTLEYLASTKPAYDDRNVISITIPEGLSLRETALLWQESGIFSADSFLDAAMNQELLDSFHIPAESFEGWLFPDTYRVPQTFTPYQAVTLMANQFFKVLEEIYPSWQELPTNKLKEQIILASIIQKEHQIAEEAPLMASVFLNRLDIGMPLGTDATISYAKKERLGEGHAQRILFQDLTLDDPYNSYTNTGLPPGPIGLSGRVALRAAFYPAETHFLYFVRIPETAGKHHFSTNFDEHRYHANIWRSWANKNLR